MGMMPTHGARFPAISGSGASAGAVAASARSLGYGSVTDPSYAGGAKGDGSSDDTAAFAAIAARGGHARVPYTGQPYKCGPVVFDKPTVLDFEAGASVSPLFNTTSAQNLFTFQSPNSGLIKPTIVGAGAVTVSTGANKTLVYAQAGATGFKIEDLNFSNCQWSDGNHGLTNLTRTNAVYLLASDTEIRGGKLDTIMGPGVFASNLTRLRIIGLTFKDVAWYNLNLDEDVSSFDIDGCTFDSSGVSYGVYWGGHINLMSQPTSPAPLVVRDGHVHRCDFKGKLSYGAVVRVLSCMRIAVDNNNFHDLDAGSGASGTALQYIGVDWRGANPPPVDNGPFFQISVTRNKMKADTGIHQAIYIKTNQVVNATRSASKFITVQGNVAESKDSSNNFESFCQFHGFTAGFEYVSVLDNQATVKTRTGTPVPGAIGVVSSDVNGQIVHLDIDNNKMEDIGTIDPTQSFQLGLYVQGWADQVFIGPRNRFKNFLRAIRTGTNVTNVTGIDGAIAEACRYENLLVAIPTTGPVGVTRSDTKPVTGIWLDGDLVYKRNQSATTALGWVCTTAGAAVTGTWASGQTYAAGLWYAGSTGKVYELITAGGGTTSVEPTHTSGDVTGADGYVWRYRASATAVLVQLAANQAS
jgi:hypothetical protein